MELKYQLDQFVIAVRTMPRDELAACFSILFGLLLIVIALLIL